MAEFQQEQPPEEFIRAYNYACLHIQQQASNEADFRWIRSSLGASIVEHLSFGVGNQLFLIFLNVKQGAEWLSYLEGAAKDYFARACIEANAIPCVMQMNGQGEQYIVNSPGWGLIHAETREEITPQDWVTDELIAMSDWELHDFAIETVKAYLEKEGKTITSWQSDLRVDPSFWFEDEKGLHWVLVRSVRYPIKDAGIPENIEGIKSTCARLSNSGFLASVAVANADDGFDPEQLPLPLYRGCGMYVNFKGLQPL